MSRAPITKIEQFVAKIIVVEMRAQNEEIAELKARLKDAEHFALYREGVDRCQGCAFLMCFDDDDEADDGDGENGRFCARCASGYCRRCIPTHMWKCTMARWLWVCKGCRCCNHCGKGK